MSISTQHRGRLACLVGQGPAGLHMVRLVPAIVSEAEGRPRQAVVRLQKYCRIGFLAAGAAVKVEEQSLHWHRVYSVLQ